MVTRRRKVRVYVIAAGSRPGSPERPPLVKQPNVDGKPPLVKQPNVDGRPPLNRQDAFDKGTVPLF